MTKVLIADAMSAKVEDILKEAGIEVVVEVKKPEDELVGLVSDVDGVIVRSATKITPRVLESAPRLRVIGRAGVGVDNIDVPAATAKGVVVMNTPFGNTTSAAEHSVAMLLALARNIPRADQKLRGGKWDKKSFTGVELSNKTLGVIGLGKIGQKVARAARGLDMNVLAFDPFITSDRAKDLDVELAEVDEVLAGADFLTLHVPLNDKTRNLINEKTRAKMKPTARIINVSRGGVVDEEALCAALKEGRVAGAALDVWGQEPLTESPLFDLPNVVATPHLGASTEEAQERVAEDVAKQFVTFFREGRAVNAVNLSVTLDKRTEPWAVLAEKLGAVVASLSCAKVKRLKVGCYGGVADLDSRAASMCALKGFLSGTAEGENINLVNAPLVAADRGIEVNEEKSSRARNFASLLLVEVEGEGGRRRSVSGTLFDGQHARIVAIDDFDLELAPAENILIMRYPDKPGMVGVFGTTLGKHGVNIAGMAVGRREKAGEAMVALTLDDPVPGSALEEIGKHVELAEARLVSL
ncbi:MAG: phosphoglycerate dehydrogenase [Planctomycetota bacterium]